MNKNEYMNMINDVTLEKGEIISVTTANVSKGRAYTQTWCMADSLDLNKDSIDIGELAQLVYRFLDSRSGRLEPKMKEFLQELMRTYNEGARYERIAIDRMLDDARAIVSHKKKPYGDI